MRKELSLPGARRGEVPCPWLSPRPVSPSWSRESVSQASQLVVVRSVLWPFLYDLEDTGHVQLPEILRDILSQSPAVFSRLRVSVGRVKT